MKLLNRVLKNYAKDAKVQPFRDDCFRQGMGLGKWGVGLVKDSIIFKVLATRSLLMIH